MRGNIPSGSRACTVDGMQTRDLIRRFPVLIRKQAIEFNKVLSGYRRAFMKSLGRRIIFFLPALLLCCSSGEDTELASGNAMTTARPAGNLLHGKWLALGDSDFDSYQTDDFKRRANLMALNADCVLSPVEVLVKDGRDFGQLKEWGGARRHDYHGNFSRSGTTVRNSMFGWREKFSEDRAEGFIEIARQLRNTVLGYEPALGQLILAELESLSNDAGLPNRPVIVQINMGINDINGYPSLYDAFTSMDSHYSWVDSRTAAIESVVDKMLDASPGVIIVLWELLDDTLMDEHIPAEQERRITSHTDHWNNNLKEIADARPSVILFEVKALLENWIGRKSDGTDKNIVIDGIHYYLEYVPSQAADDEVDNAKYIVTRDGHGNTILSALFTRELYRLFNDSFGAGIPPLTPVQINTIACQVENPTDEIPVLEVPRDMTIRRADLPYVIGEIKAFDANGKDISDSAVATSNNGGVLFGDGQNLQLRSPRHNIGMHHIAVTVRDAYGLTASKTLTIVIE